MAQKLHLVENKPGLKQSRKKDTFLWDSKVPQLAERRKGDARSWVVQTRVNGKTIRRKIGNFGDVSLKAARAMALAQLAELENTALEVRGSVSIKDFAPRFLADCAHQWKPSTLEGHRQGIKGQIVPFLGGAPIGQLSREDVIHWRMELSCAAGTKNRALAVLSAMVRHAEILGLRPPGQNPCAGLRRHKSSFEAEYLDAAGFAALHQVLERNALAYPLAVPFVRFIALTGCRKGEAIAARWDQLDGKRLALLDSKSGPKAIWLGKPVRDLLASLPRHGVGIFAGDNPKSLEAELRFLWKDVRKSLRRPTLRIHDLRHSFASVAVNRGLDLRVIGGLLGHTDIETTAGYAHLDTTRIAEASERIGKHLSAAFESRKQRPPAKRKCAFKRFLNSKLTLQAFCEAEGVDQERFRRDLIAWRKSQGARAGQ